MSKGQIFVADYDYDSQNEGELGFRAGDRLRIENNEGDWWFGVIVGGPRNGGQGWISPSYGHIEEVVAPPPPKPAPPAPPAPISPAASPRSAANPVSPSSAGGASDQEKLARRANLFKEIIRIENAFCQDLEIFNRVVVTSLMTRNTPFKRNFMNESSIAVSLTLMKEIHVASQKFINDMTMADSADKLALCYLNLAPTLKLYAQYAQENAACLNAVKSFGRQLKEFTTEHALPQTMSLESCFVLPLSHYSKYSINFQEFVLLTPPNRPELGTLLVSLEAVFAETEKVDETLNELAASVKLLALQSQFVGHPKIFIPSRKLMLEGELERVRTTGGNVAVKSYYIHVFNDSLICSQRNESNDTFKLAKTIDLTGASTSPITLPGMTHCFSVTGAGSTEIFRCQSGEDYDIWLDQIDNVIIALKSKRADPSRNTNAGVLAVQNSSNSLPPTKSLGDRALALHKFLSLEMRLSDLVTAMITVIFKPLFDASNGSLLIVGGVPPPANTSALAATQKQITEALQAKGMKTFLAAAAALTTGLKEFVNQIKTMIEGASWGESFNIGAIFNSETAKKLFDTYKAYAMGQQGCVRVLKGSLFANFFKDAENALSGYPGSLTDKLENPRNRPSQYLEFLNQLLQVTPSGHSDRSQIETAARNMTTISTDVEGTVKSRKNVEKLLEIQSCLVIGFGGGDKFINNLIQPTRKFIKEGDLKKVCRKQNKLFRFWLFNDFLCYGSSLGGSSYSFHRSLDLKTCSASLLTTPKNAFQIRGAEKSFIVIASHENHQIDWVNKIKEARAALGVQEDDTSGTAPVWETDNSGRCFICKQNFTLFRRRHHCRKCGGLVCGEHSNHNEVLPNIHKTQKQRVCDRCYGNNNVQEVVKTVAKADAPAASPAQSNKAPAQASNKTVTTTISPPNTSRPIVSSPSAPATSRPAAPPAPAVKSNFTANNDDDDDDDLFGNSKPNAVNKAPAPPAPPAVSNVVAPPPPPPSGKSTIKISEIAKKEPEEAPAAAPVDPFANDPRYAPYVKMRKLLPEGPVRQKMMADGILSESEMDGFFNGVYVTAGSSSGAGTRPPPPSGAQSGLAAALSNVKLTTAQNKARPVSVAVSSLAKLIGERRVNIKDESDEDDSDGGFSDDDFDD